MVQTQDENKNKSILPYKLNPQKYTWHESWPLLISFNCEIGLTLLTPTGPYLKAWKKKLKLLLKICPIIHSPRCFKKLLVNVFQWPPTISLTSQQNQHMTLTWHLANILFNTWLLLHQINSATLIRGLTWAWLKANVTSTLTWALA